MPKDLLAQARRVVYKTCSPYLDQWNRGPGFEFEIPAVPAGKKARRGGGKV